jgi:hypothetical protein
MQIGLLRCQRVRGLQTISLESLPNARDVPDRAVLDPIAWLTDSTIANGFYLKTHSNTIFSLQNDEPPARK